MTAVYVEDGPDKGAIWHFGEPNKEQRELEAGKAWADLSHLSIVAVSGDDRLKWLHDLTTQHLSDFGVGVWAPALILDPQGHVEYQFSLVDDGSATYLVIDPQYAETFGATAMQVGTWALDAERVAAGRPRHGFDTDFKSIPNELGILHTSVHMNKGCYRGQETVAKIYNLGKPPRRLVMLHLDGHAVVMPPSGTPVMNGEVQVGFLGTVARHHELGPIALAVVKRNTPVDAELMVEGVAASQQIIVEA